VPWHEIDVIDLYLCVQPHTNGECEIWNGPLVNGAPAARFRGTTVDARQLSMFCYDDDIDERYPMEWPWAVSTCGNALCCRRSHLRAQPKGQDLLTLYHETIPPVRDAKPYGVAAALAGRPARPLR
jgi:hypothetical protein